LTCWQWAAICATFLYRCARPILNGARRPEGIFVNPFEGGEIGRDLFRAACRMGLEGLVSRHRDRAYRGGPCRHWVKVKNPESPAMKRTAEVDWSR
jgi:ATP-dependent DNA ligase